MKKTRSIGKFFKILFYIIAIPILIIAGIIIYKANRYPDKIPDVFGIKPMIVLSGSMETSIHTGDLVFVKIVDIDTLKPDDIVSYRTSENKVITHRIVEVTEQNGKKYFKTKGDANEEEDEGLVESTAIEGLYIARFEGIGNFLMFMQQPTGLIIVLLVILILGLIWLNIENKKDEKRFSEEEELERKEFEEYKRNKEKQQRENINKN